MSRKTHPISHRLGITTWWPSRTPMTSLKPRSLTKTKAGRYQAISHMIKGIISKYGYEMSTPSIMETVESKGRIIIIIKKVAIGQGQITQNVLEQWLRQQRITEKVWWVKPKEGMIAHSPAYQKYAQKLDESSVIVLTYIAQYIASLVSEYENCTYRVDIREIRQITTQGTASIIAENLALSDRSIIPAMADMQRRLIKSQAYIEHIQVLKRPIYKRNI